MVEARVSARRSLRAALRACAALVAPCAVATCAAPLPESITLASAHTLTEAVDLASAQYGVPRDVLLAVAYAESRWDAPPAPEAHEASAADARHEAGAVHGVTELGPLHLRHSAGIDTLTRATELLGVTEVALRGSLGLQVAGAAAVLADLGRNTGAQNGVEDSWAEAVARYSGLRGRDLQVSYANDVWDVLRHGRRDTAYTGEQITLPAREGEDVDTLLHVDTVGEFSADYPDARWVPSAGQFDTGRGGNRIQYIVIHDMQGSYAGSVGGAQSSSYCCSVQYWIRSSDGEITQMVRNSDTAWHAGNYHINQTSIGIEHEGFFDNPGRWYTEAMYRASARLVRHLCDTYGIPIDREHIIGHYQVPVSGSGAPCGTGATGCGGSGGHVDPGPGGSAWDWNHYMDLVRGSSSPNNPPPAPAPGSCNATQQSYSLFNCNRAGNAREKCVGGRLVTEACANGCDVRPNGVDDVCRAAPHQRLADVTVTSLTFTPANPRPGDTVRFHATVKNNGGPTNAIVGVGFFVNNRYVGWASRNPMRAGEVDSRSFTMRQTWTAGAEGVYAIKAFVDDVNRIRESNKNNNTLIRALHVSAAPPAVETCPCLPSTNNFCLYGSRVPGCAMTFPGGYCYDANGDATTDGLIRGRHDYQARCGGSVGANPAAMSCGEWAVQSGYRRAACEQNVAPDDPAYQVCSGAGVTTSDCLHCCDITAGAPPARNETMTCGDWAREQHFANPACEQNVPPGDPAYQACHGAGVRTSDCARCCDLGASPPNPPNPPPTAPMVDFTVNGTRLSGTQERWARYVGTRVVPHLGSGAREQRIHTAAVVAWWGLKEGTFDLENPFDFSLCSVAGSGDQRIGPFDGCAPGRAWQVGLAGVQVNSGNPGPLEASATALYPGQTVEQVLSATAQDAGEDGTAVNATVGRVRASWLLRNSAVGFTAQFPAVNSECITGAQSWCYGRGWTTSRLFAPSKEASLRSIADLERIFGGLAP